MLTREMLSSMATERLPLLLPTHGLAVGVGDTVGVGVAPVFAEDVGVASGGRL